METIKGEWERMNNKKITQEELDRLNKEFNESVIKKAIDKVVLGDKLTECEESK